MVGVLLRRGQNTRAIEEEGVEWGGPASMASRSPPSPPPLVAPVSAGGSHAVSMASLLSGDTGTPREDAFVAAQRPPAPSQRSRTGMSSLMNSPMADDDVDMDAPVETRAVEIRDEDPYAVDMHVGGAHESKESGKEEEDEQEDEEDEGDARSATDESPTKTLKRPEGAASRDPQSVDRLVLSDPELEALKGELQVLMWKYLSAQGKYDAPATKRQKKGKQNRRSTAARAQASAEHLAEIERCIGVLNTKAAAQFDSPSALSELVRFCLAFFEALNEKDAVDTAVVRLDEGESVDLSATIKKLAGKPLYLQLAGVIRRAVACASGESVGILLAQVHDWCASSSSASSWTWVFVLLASIDSYSTLEFLITQAAKHAEEASETSSTLLVAEHVATQYSSQAVDIVRKLLEECAVPGRVEVHGEPVDRFVHSLIALGCKSRVIVRLCDDSLQWIVTEQLVTGVAKNLSSLAPAPGSNGSTLGGTGRKSLSVHLLELLDKRGDDLSASGFHLVVMLQKLLADQSMSLSLDVSAFYEQFVDFAHGDRSTAFLRGMFRFLPYMCKTTLRALYSADEDDEMDERSGPRSQFAFWTEWLVLLATAVSRKEVLRHLVETDLLLAEFSPHDPAELGTSAPDHLFGELLNSILPPSSPEYLAFVRGLVEDCRSGASTVRERRLLVVLHTLFASNKEETQKLLDDTSAIPVALTSAPGKSAAGPLDQLLGCPSWGAACKSFGQWKGCRGIDFWEGFLDLSRSRYQDVSDCALELLEQTPFQTLEDPVWQYRCLRKLTVTFFATLRHYREELVRRASSSASIDVASGDSIRQRLQKLKVIMFRLLALEGGVANYPSSVFSVFASLWVDFLLSHQAATSIPTHFPNRINFTHEDSHESTPDERVVIRSERTISSKCTNLQASKVITQVPESLVYRKTLDLSWEKEMDAARVCSMYASDLLVQVLATAGTVPPLALSSRVLHGDDLCERRLKIIVDLLLERVIPCCGIPSDDTYKEVLPNRSSFDVDLRIEQWLNHFPAFLPLLELVVSASASIHSQQSLRLLPLVKSALIVLLGHWNSVKGALDVENLDVPPYMRNRNQLALSCTMLALLRATGWVPAPLGRAAELLPLTTPADIRAILFSCWFYLSDHPPMSSRAPTPATSAPSSPVSSGSSPAGMNSASASDSGFPGSPQLEFYLIPLRKALHRNIHKVGAKYPLFMC